MHDPMVVAFTLRRPWPRRSSLARIHRDRRWRISRSFWTLAGHEFYWPGLITVWHVDPGGYDAFDKCPRGSHWRWHVHHWHIQIAPLQHLRRWALTRCEWCAGRSRKGDRVNVSHSWDTAKTRWWRGESGLYHSDCSSVYGAHRTCTCTDPVLEHGVGGSGYGQCARCGRFRGWQASQRALANAAQLREAIGEGCRDKDRYTEIVRGNSALPNR